MYNCLPVLFVQFIILLICFGFFIYLLNREAKLKKKQNNVFPQLFSTFFNFLFPPCLKQIKFQLKLVSSFFSAFEAPHYLNSYIPGMNSLRNKKLEKRFKFENGQWSKSHFLASKVFFSLKKNKGKKSKVCPNFLPFFVFYFHSFHFCMKTVRSLCWSPFCSLFSLI